MSHRICIVAVTIMLSSFAACGDDLDDAMKACQAHTMPPIPIPRGELAPWRKIHRPNIQMESPTPYQPGFENCLQVVDKWRAQHWSGPQPAPPAPPPPSNDAATINKVLK